MTESLALPLRLPDVKFSKQDSLQARIFQIHSQKGSFRHVTEASLDGEVKSQREDKHKLEAQDEGESAIEAPDRRKMIINKRDEMLQQLR